MLFSIKIAEIKDLPIIEALARKIMLEHYVSIFGRPKTEYLLSKFYQTSALEAQQKDDQIFYLVYDENQLAIGFFSFIDQSNGCFFIPKFYMISDQQGKGLGSQILQALFKMLEPDLREIRLNVNRLNYKSINFYFKNGFFIENWKDIPVGDGFEMNVFQMLFLKK